jgi:nucleotide-binding universal stress UspA family protein
MYEKILLPLDGSEIGEAAIADIEDIAVKMGRETPVEITLLRVIPHQTYNFFSRPLGS